MDSHVKTLLEEMNQHFSEGNRLSLLIRRTRDRNEDEALLAIVDEQYGDEYRQAEQAFINARIPWYDSLNRDHYDLSVEAATAIIDATVGAVKQLEQVAADYSAALRTIDEPKRVALLESSVEAHFTQINERDPRLENDWATVLWNEARLLFPEVPEDIQVIYNKLCIAVDEARQVVTGKLDAKKFVLVDNLSDDKEVSDLMQLLDPLCIDLHKATVVHKQGLVDHQIEELRELFRNIKHNVAPADLSRAEDAFVRAINATDNRPDTALTVIAQARSLFEDIQETPLEV